VTTTSACTWTATSSQVDHDHRRELGRRQRTVAFTIAQHRPERTATLTIAGQTSTVTQAPSSPCRAPIASRRRIRPSAMRGAGTPVNVTAGTGCAWTAVSTAPGSRESILVGERQRHGELHRRGKHQRSNRNGTIVIAGRRSLSPECRCAYTLARRLRCWRKRRAWRGPDVTAATGAHGPTSNVTWITFTSAGRAAQFGERQRMSGSSRRQYRRPAAASSLLPARRPR